MQQFIKDYYWLFLLVPGVAYLLLSYGLKVSDKPWTASAWFCYAVANVSFLMAFVRGE